MLVKGYGGTVEFDGQFVTIRHTGLGRLTAGKDDRRIHVSSITGVRIKPAGVITNGFIQFTVPGSGDPRSGNGRSAPAVHDENSLIFTRKQQEEFDRLRTTVERAVVAVHVPRPVVSREQQAFGGGIAGQLAQLAQLHASGALSNDEFAAAQSRLLG
jgi:hypothetical protein